jgi:hypothetical protein
MQIDLLAYIGPGSGLELVGAMIGLLVTLGTSASFVLLYPIRKFIRSRRGIVSAEPTEEIAEETAAPKKMAA